VSAADRRWLEVRARCSAPPEERQLLASGLVDLGARGVEERDATFVAWFEEPDDPGAFLTALPQALASETGLSGIRVESRWQAHEDWAENWKRGLGERRLTERVVVRPSWIDPVDVRDGDLEIVLDPGMAFGTAEHGTTRGCIRLLDRVVGAGDRLLDVGAGSGILSIAAVRLGAGHVHAIEGDPLACEALAENVDRNGVGDVVAIEVAFATADSLASSGPVSGIVANIETGLLAPLFAGFARALEAGGWLIVSGILEHEWADVRETLEEEGFAFEALDSDDAWRSGLFRLPAPSA
jgi:ribosomal protein L11 methyltransferase